MSFHMHYGLGRLGDNLFETMRHMNVLALPCPLAVVVLPFMSRIRKSIGSGNLDHGDQPNTKFIDSKINGLFVLQLFQKLLMKSHKSSPTTNAFANFIVVQL